MLMLLPLVLVACSQPVKLSGTTEEAVDFTGSWEMNYQLSDRVQENAQLLRLIAIANARRAQGSLDGRWILPSFELIEFADSISRTEVLEIEHGNGEIEVQRGDDFPWNCTFGSMPEFEEDPFGTELCGWDGHQLVFAFALPDGLNVVQRMTLSPDGEYLNIATTVSSRGVGQSFTLNRVYNRFEPLPDEFECRPDAGGGKTCTRRVTRLKSTP